MYTMIKYNLISLFYYIYQLTVSSKLGFISHMCSPYYTNKVNNPHLDMCPISLRNKKEPGAIDVTSKVVSLHTHSHYSIQHKKLKKVRLPYTNS